MNAHFQHCAQKPTLESSQCSLWARRCGIQEAIWLYYFTYSFTTKRGVLVFAVLWRSFLMRARQEGIVPLSQGYFPELCRNGKCLSTPTRCQARVGQKRQWDSEISCSLYNFTSSKCNKQLKTWSFRRRRKKISLRGKQWNVSLSVAAAMWWFKRPFVPTPPVRSVQTATLSGTDIKFSGRNSSLIGLFTSVCNGRDPL